MIKLWRWVQNNFFAVAALFLLAFIPLYPKIPLLDIVQTWVYIRLEDIFVAALLVVLLYFVIKRRFSLSSALTRPILVYWGIGFVILITSIFFISRNTPDFFPHLALLHYLRRIEYMMVFFLALLAVRQSPWVRRVLPWVLCMIVLMVFLYGLGQKFLGLPAFLTMNEEFAKGIPLRLPSTARIPSTFGGHYDLAAYLVLVIPILGSFVFGFRRYWQKLVALFLAMMSLVLLLFTASRISFGVYLIAISVMLLWQKKKILIIPVIIVSIIFLQFVSGTAERFAKTFRMSDVIIDLSTGQTVGTLEKLEGSKAVVHQEESPAVESLPKGSSYLGAPPVEVATKPAKTVKTLEIYKSYSLASGSGEIATVSGSFLIEKAFVYDISITTRFQGQWPKATEAFRRSMLLGSGFSSLSVASDGDYLRMLGETGIVGTVAFLGIFIAAFTVFFRRKDLLSPLDRAIVIGLFAGIVGLFFNAILIDVFEASKVAFTMWILLGFAMGILAKEGESFGSYRALLWRVFTGKFALGAYLSVLIIVVYKSALSHYFVADDFVWLRWAATTPLDKFSAYFSDASGFFYRPIPKIFFLFLYSIFWLKPLAYHLASLSLFASIAMLVLHLAMALGVRKILAFAAAVLFSVLAVHHESIFWISNLGHLLAVVFFLSSLLMLIRSGQSKTHVRRMHWGSVILLILSMLSSESMMVAPLVYILFRWKILGIRKLSSFLYLLLIPIYLWMRTNANAVSPGGDYGYKAITLLPNMVGNSIGYLGAIFFGPTVVEHMAQLRIFFKAGALWISAGLFIVLGMATVWLRRSRDMLKNHTHVLVFVLAAFVVMMPFLGLGNMAERYAIFGSPFIMVALAMWVESWWKTLWGKRELVCVLFSVFLFIWNVQEIERVKLDWQKASDITQKSLLTMRTVFFPLNRPETFIVANVPIRFGRAWIFPTGMYDALWHIFKFNGFPIEVIGVPTLPDAYKVPAKNHVEVLIYEDYVLKRGVKEVQTIEVGE